MFGAVRRAQQRAGEGSEGYKGPDAFRQQEAPRPLAERDHSEGPRADEVQRQGSARVLAQAPGLTGGEGDQDEKGTSDFDEIDKVHEFAARRLRWAGYGNALVRGGVGKRRYRCSR
jgi:hypothetical protein